MRIANEDGQFEDTCQGECTDCTCEETVVEIPEVGGNPFGEAGMSKYPSPTSSPSFETKKEVKEFSNAFAKQVGGDHYKDLAIQPTEFIMKNKLDFLEGCIIKRICRYKKKGFPLQDLRKAQHEIDMIIELEGL